MSTIGFCDGESASLFLNDCFECALERIQLEEFLFVRVVYTGGRGGCGTLFPSVQGDKLKTIIIYNTVYRTSDKGQLLYKSKLSTIIYRNFRGEIFSWFLWFK